MKTFKEMLIEQYNRLPQFEVEVDSQGVYVWHKEDKVGTTYRFDEQGDLTDTY